MSSNKKDAIQSCARRVLDKSVAPLPAPAKTAGKKKPAPKPKPKGKKGKKVAVEAEEPPPEPKDEEPAGSGSTTDPTMSTLLGFDEIVQTCVSVVESLSEQLTSNKTDFGGKGPDAGGAAIDRALLKESLQGDLLTEAMNSGVSVSLAKQYDLASGFALEFSNTIDAFVLNPMGGAVRPRGTKTERDETPLDQPVATSLPKVTGGNVPPRGGHPSIYDELQPANRQMKTGTEDDWRSKRRRFETEDKPGNAPLPTPGGKFGGPMSKRPMPPPKPSGMTGQGKNSTINNKNTSGHDDGWGAGLLAAPAPQNNQGGLLAAPAQSANAGGLLMAPPVPPPMPGPASQAFLRAPPQNGGFSSHVGYQQQNDGWGNTVPIPVMAPPPMYNQAFVPQQPLANQGGGNFVAQQQPKQRANPDQRFVVIENVECRGTTRQLNSFLFNALNYLAQGDEEVKKVLNLIVLPMSKILELQGRKPMAHVAADEMAKKKDGEEDRAPTTTNGVEAKESPAQSSEMYACVASMRHPQIAMTLLRNPFHLKGQDKAILRAASSEEIEKFRDEFVGQISDAEKAIATNIETQQKKWELRALLANKEAALKEEASKLSAETESLKPTEDKPDDTDTASAAKLVVLEAKSESLQDQLSKLQSQLRALGPEPTHSNSSTQPRHAGNIYMLDVTERLADQQVQIVFNCAFPFVQPNNLWRDSDGGHNLCVGLGGYDQPQKIMAFLDASNYELKVVVGVDKDTETGAQKDRVCKIRFTQYSPQQTQ